MITTDKPQHTLQLTSLNGKVNLRSYGEVNVLIKPINDNVTLSTLTEKKNNTVFEHPNQDSTFYREQEYWGRFNEIEVDTGTLLVLIF